MSPHCGLTVNNEDITVGIREIDFGKLLSIEKALF